jgi:hypothetical protein
MLFPRLQPARACRSPRLCFRPWSYIIQAISQAHSEEPLLHQSFFFFELASRKNLRRFNITLYERYLSNKTFQLQTCINHQCFPDFSSGLLHAQPSPASILHLTSGQRASFYTIYRQIYLFVVFPESRFKTIIKPTTLHIFIYIFVFGLSALRPCPVLYAHLLHFYIT